MSYPKFYCEVCEKEVNAREILRSDGQKTIHYVGCSKYGHFLARGKYQGMTREDFQQYNEANPAVMPKKMA